MDLLYISHLSTNIAAGLNWSVPASVQAQSKIDNVLWVNMTDVVMQHWKQVDVYHKAPWEYDAKDDQICVLHTLVISPRVKTKKTDSQYYISYETDVKTGIEVKQDADNNFTISAIGDGVTTKLTFIKAYMLNNRLHPFHHTAYINTAG